jgi:predicted metal-dependent phosphoesterase TrpH
MSSDDIVANLHLHTTASDGTVSVDQRLTQAKQTGLKTIAITDHDTIAPELTSRRQLRDGVELITGVELKADVMSKKIELLGYYVDPSDEELSGLLDQAREYRRNRNDSILDNLSKATDLDLSRADIPSTRGALGRPHIANYLVETDIVLSNTDRI